MPNAARPLRPAALAGAAVLSLLTACSGGDDASPGARLSAQEAQAVMSALFAEMGGAVGGLFSAAPASGQFDGAVAARGAARAAVELATRSALRRGVAATPSGTVTADCQRGGRITVAYTKTDNTDAAGTGTVSGSLTVTPQGCVVPAGSRTIVVTGDPSLAYSYSGAFVRGAPSGNFVFRGTGGFVWSGGGCRVDYTVTVTPQATATLSGSICGQNVSGTFTGA